MRTGRVLGIAVVALPMGVLAGCSVVPAAEPSLPDGVSVTVYQTRSDLGPRRLQVSVTNGSAEPLTITRLVFDSEQFVAPSAWEKDSTTIVAGATADLPVLLAAPACAADRPRAVVHLGYRLGDGASQTGSGIPIDPADRLPRLEEEDCFAASVLKHTNVEANALPREVKVDGRLLAELDLAFTPMGTAGSVTIDGVLDTVLLGLVDPGRGLAIDELPVNVAVDAWSEPFTVTLLLAPGRCDAHALAEDKRGTIIPVRATTTAGSGILPVTTEDNVRRALYEFVQRSCAG